MFGTYSEHETRLEGAPTTQGALIISHETRRSNQSQSLPQDVHAQSDENETDVGHFVQPIEDTIQCPVADVSNHFQLMDDTEYPVTDIGNPVQPVDDTMR